VTCIVTYTYRYKPGNVRPHARERGMLLQAEREKSLPADVPLHQRGFGVMDEDGA
jgi:hypothetical protein